jgi:hypothetical protein
MRLTALVLLFMLLANPAFAACGSPPTGATTDGLMRLKGTGVGFGSVLSNGTSQEGDLAYDATNHVIAVCNGSSWIDLSAGSLPSLASTNVWVGNTSNVATATATTGTGNVVMSASPTFTGTITGAASNWSGNVGIGTTSPINSLDVYGTTTTAGVGNISARNSATNTAITLETYNSGVPAGNLGIIQTANSTGATVQPLSLNPFGGNVGIGTTSPGATFEVNGNMIIDGLPNYATGSYVCIYLVGHVLNYGSSCSSSDVRLKKDIAPLQTALDKISKLRGVSFHWKDASRGTRPQIGLIAQEVEKIFPEIVDTNADGLKNLQYDKLVAPLIEAVKELKADNDTLRAANDNEAAEIKALRADIEQLKAARH